MTSLNSPARFCARHGWLVLLAWLALAAALVVGAARAPGATTEDFALPGSESRRAADLLGDRPAEPQGRLVVSAPAGVRAPEVRWAVTALIARMNTVPGVTVAVPPAEGSRPRPSREAPYEQVSADGTVATVPIRHTGEESAARLKELRDAFRAPTAPGTPVLTAELSGDDFADFAPGGLIEGVGLLAAAVILLLAFRSLIATALPLLMGVTGVICAVSLLSLLGNVVPTPGFAVYVTVMLGLGVGIDYALLVVTRFRASLGECRTVEDAVVRAMTTAGRSVLFAGITVIITGAGILFLGPSLGGGIALAAGCGVLMVMLTALTLLPALLGLLGTRVDRLSLPHRGGTTGPLARRWSRAVQRRPLVAGALALGLLLGLALPAASLRFGWSDAGNRPVSDTTRRAHELLAGGFGPGAAGPLVLVSAEPLGRAVAQAASTPGVAGVTALDERTALVVPETGPQEEATTGLVHALRAGLPAPVLVTGATAAGVDFAEHSFDRLPWMVGAVLLASFALLVPVFRSLVVPLKAIAVNLLSIGASYGAVVAIFQWDVLGLGAGGPVDAWVPMMLFVITFGLTMDYEVFLLSRIQEEYARTRDNSRAVTEGLAATARVITAAAAIMFCVFAAFGTFDDRPLRILGVGLAAAVLIDATVVRLVLVPSAMELLGDRNWWFPGTGGGRAAGGPGRGATMVTGEQVG
ncbi:MMPL family transporter [Streptosporangium sp. NPDC023825]|uniref:MMPL family transporter n=1 Tax=Streptosporangium sp. NPDC023825 TaxID=3154909 RepID=UPI003433FFB4